MTTEKPGIFDGNDKLFLRAPSLFVFVFVWAVLLALIFGVT